MSEYVKELEAHSLEEALVLLKQTGQDPKIAGLGEVCIKVKIFGKDVKICLDI